MKALIRAGLAIRRTPLGQLTRPSSLFTTPLHKPHLDLFLFGLFISSEKEVLKTSLKEVRRSFSLLFPVEVRLNWHFIQKNLE